MKDTVRKILASILSLGGMAVLGYYMNQGVSVVKEYVMQYNYYIIGAIFVILLFFFLQFGLGLLPGKWLKVRAVVVGILLVLMGYYFIENNATTTIYAGDIISILGVLMVYLTLVGLIVTKKAEKKVLQGRQIVIEV